MTAFKDKTPRSYSQEDVQQILYLAIARQADDKDKEFSYEQLLEIAAELEITPESLKLAEREWIAKQGEIQQRQAFNTYRKNRFQKRLGNYAIVNAFLMSVDWLGGSDLSWSLYILLCCGLLIGLDAWNLLHMKGEEYEMAFQRWNRKHQVKKFFNTVVSKWLQVWQS